MAFPALPQLWDTVIWGLYPLQVGLYSPFPVAAASLPAAPSSLCCCEVFLSVVQFLGPRPPLPWVADEWERRQLVVLVVTPEPRE